MVLALVMIAAWIVVGGSLYYWYEVRYYKKDPSAWNRRMECLISFTDSEKKWLYIFWPFVAIIIALSAALFVICHRRS